MSGPFLRLWNACTAVLFVAVGCIAAPACGTQTVTPAPTAAPGLPPLVATPLAELLEGLDPRVQDIMLRVEVVRFGRGIPGWPDDKPFSKTVATAKFAGARFIIDYTVEDYSVRRPPLGETVAFDGRRSFVRGAHSPNWFIVGRSFRLSPDLQQLGFVDQSGRGLGWLAVEEQELADDLARAIELARREEGGRLSVRYAFAPPATSATLATPSASDVRQDERGELVPRGDFELVVDRVGIPPAERTRMLALGDRSTELGADGTPFVVRRSGIRALAWQTTSEGLELPFECEYVVEHTPRAGAARSNRSQITILEATLAPREETLAAIEAFSRPRRNETVFDTDLRLQFRVGERRFLLEGALYEANSPLESVPGETGPEILRQARRLDGGVRELGPSPAFGAPPQPMNAVGDSVRWFQVILGALFIGAGLVIWRRA